MTQQQMELTALHTCVHTCNHMQSHATPDPTLHSQTPVYISWDICYCNGYRGDFSGLSPRETTSLPSVTPLRYQGSVHIELQAAPMPSCLLGADASESVCACFSLSLEAFKHTNCVSESVGLHAMVPSLGIQGPSSDAVWLTTSRQPSHLPSLDRQFFPTEQCPAPWGLPVYPLAHHPSGFRGNTKFTQPGPPLLLHAHCLQHR